MEIKITSRRNTLPAGNLTSFVIKCNERYVREVFSPELLGMYIQELIKIELKGDNNLENGVETSDAYYSNNPAGRCKLHKKVISTSFLKATQMNSAGKNATEITKEVTHGK